MKLFDKLKDALFEEEYVDVPDKPVKEKKEKEHEKSKFRSNIDRIKEETRIKDVKVTNYDDTFDDEEEEEEQVAKKIIDVREKNEEPVKEKKSDFIFPEDDSFFTDTKEERTKIDADIPLLDSDEKEERREAVNRIVSEEVKEEPKKEEKPKLYGGYNENLPYKTNSREEYVKKFTSSEYGTYPKTKEKHGFKPSPNISPVYGIIDDSEPKEEEVKREVRLTTAIPVEKPDIDEVRKKVLGLDREEEEEEKETPIDEDFIDLTNTDKPSVNKVTMGDAEEYYDDLGLEYNSDYIDANKTKSRVKKDEEYEKVKKENNSDDEEGTPKKEDKSNDVKNIKKVSSDDDNLFDLIDSMYDNEK